MVEVDAPTRRRARLAATNTNGAYPLEATHERVEAEHRRSRAALSGLSNFVMGGARPTA